MKHRAEAQRQAGQTEAQRQALALGRQPGTNHRDGYKHKAESKRKTSRSHKRWCAANPDKVQARGMKVRGPLHYQWKGGSSRLNSSVRQMNEHRKWTDAVRARDGGACMRCGSLNNLEAHHIAELAVLIAQHGIKNRDDARACSALWDINNGATLCRRCHYLQHGRRHANR